MKHKGKPRPITFSHHVLVAVFIIPFLWNYVYRNGTTCFKIVRLCLAIHKTVLFRPIEEGRTSRHGLLLTTVIKMVPRKARTMIAQSLSDM
jgi:hypothetical protein